MGKFGDFMENAQDKIGDFVTGVTNDIPIVGDIADAAAAVGDGIFNYDGMFDGDGNPWKDNPNKRPRPDSAPSFGTGKPPVFGAGTGFKPGQKPGMTATATTSAGGGGCGGSCSCKPEYSCQEKCAFKDKMKEWRGSNECKNIRACMYPRYRRKTYKKKNSCGGRVWKASYNNGKASYGWGKRTYVARPKPWEFKKYGQPYRRY
jgi:hypothetical protein